MNTMKFGSVEVEVIEPPLGFARHPFEPKDWWREDVRREVANTATIFREESKRSVLHATGDELILEDAGTIVKWTAWADQTGHYVAWRRAPLYAHLPGVAEAEARAIERWVKAHPPSQGHLAQICVLEEDDVDPNCGITILSSIGSMHSCGD